MYYFFRDDMKYTYPSDKFRVGIDELLYKDEGISEETYRLLDEEYNSEYSKCNFVNGCDDW